MRLTTTIQAFTLALLVIITSVKVNLNTHFCGGVLKSLALYADAKPCEMQSRAHHPNCPFHPANNETNQDEKPGCCEDETQIIETQDYLSNGFHFDFQEAVYGLIPATYTYLSELKVFNKISGQYFYTDSSPPIHGIQLCILVQSFLL